MICAGPPKRRRCDAFSITLLDHVNRLNHAAANLPATVRHRGLRLETATIHGLAKRLARRLAQGDPLAKRVKLRKFDAAGSVLASLSYLT